MMDAKSLVNPATGRAVPNHLVITDGNGKITLKSYNSRVCAVDVNADLIMLGRDWDYSATTRRWLYVFLSDIVQWRRVKGDDVRRAITAGTIQAAGRAWAVTYIPDMQ